MWPGYTHISQYTCVWGTRLSLSIRVSGVHAYLSVHLCPGYTRISQYTCVRGTRISLSTRVSGVHAYLSVHLCPWHSFSEYTYVRDKHVSLIHVFPGGKTISPVHIQVCPVNTHFPITRVSVIHSFPHYTCIRGVTCVSRAHVCPWYERFSNIRVFGKHAFPEHACVRGTPSFERVL